MSTVIKASEQSTRGVAFNFDDLAAQADTYLEKVRGKASQIVDQAARDAVAVRQAAEAEGRQLAQKAIDEMLDRKLAAQLETVLPALRAAASEIQISKQGWLAHWERQAVHLATAIAGRVCRGELARQPEITPRLVREALELAGGGGRVRLLLNPDDHTALGQQVERVVKETSRLASTELVADPRISRGGCRVETEFGAIDQQFEAQLARIEQELT